MGAVLLLFPLLSSVFSSLDGHLTLIRVGDTVYYARVTGCVPNTEYLFQYNIQTTYSTWLDVGYFTADSAGVITTWELGLPNADFATSFRFVNAENYKTTNIVTIYPDDPPPIDDPTADTQTASFDLYFILLGLGTTAVGVVVTAVETKKLKLPI